MSPCRSRRSSTATQENKNSSSRLPGAWCSHRNRHGLLHFTSACLILPGNPSALRLCICKLPLCNLTTTTTRHITDHAPIYAFGGQGCETIPWGRPGRITVVSYISSLLTFPVWPEIVSHSGCAVRDKCAQPIRRIAQSAGKNISSMLHSAIRITRPILSAPTAQSSFGMICETVSARALSAQTA